MTAREKFGATGLRGRKIAVSWAYAPSYQKPMSVPQSLIALFPRFGMDVVLAHPPEFDLLPEIVTPGARRRARRRHEVRDRPRHGRSLRGRRTWSTPRAGAA